VAKKDAFLLCPFFCSCSRNRIVHKQGLQHAVETWGTQVWRVCCPYGVCGFCGTFLVTIKNSQLKCFAWA